MPQQLADAAETDRRLAAAANAAAVSSRTGRPVIFLRSLLHSARRALDMRLEAPNSWFSKAPPTRRKKDRRRIERRIVGGRRLEVRLGGPVAPEARRPRTMLLRLDFLAA